MINIERVISKTPMVIADYFTEDGLLKQVGLVKEYWNRIVVKELTDNALDAIEPLQDKKVFMDVTSGSLGIYDNGTGIKKETVEDIYDFENYVSQNRNYITASRGKQGNGLKTIISICYIQGYRLLWHTAEGIILEANIDSEQLRYGRLEVSFVEIGVTDKRGIEIIGIGAVENFLYDYFIGYSKCNPDVSFYLNYFGEKIENLAKMEGIDKSKNISIAYYDYDSYQNFIIHTQDGNTTYKQFLDNVFGTRMKNKSNIKSKIKDIDFKSDEFIKDFLMLKEDQQTKKYTLLKKQLIGLENILTTTVEIVDNEAPKGMNDKVIPCIVEFSVKKDREMITEWNYRTPLTCDEACELEEFRMLNDLKEKSERRDFYSKIGGTELSEEKIEKATFGKEFEIFYLENYRLKLHERVPALTTDEIENISIYALDLVRSKKEMSEEEYKNAEREMDIEISRMAFEHLYDDIKEVHERLPYLTPEECQEWFDCWKRWSAFQDNKLWNILTFDYVMRGWKLEELNDQREKNMSSLFDYIVLGNQEGKIKDGSE